MTSPVGEGVAVRSFRIDVPEEELVDLRRRVAATRWPDKETVSDRSQGVQLAKLRQLVEYWGTDYDWRKVEATLNELPQFTTEIDGLDIQFAHIRSPHDDAMPLLMTHGWHARGTGRLLACCSVGSDVVGQSLQLSYYLWLSEQQGPPRQGNQAREVAI
jgi:hypothetical protein